MATRVTTDWLERHMPFPRRFVSVGEGRLHVIDDGPRDGPPLVMLHGNPTWSFHFREVIRAFGSTNRVVAVDHLGCGGSDKPPDGSYRLETHIRNVIRVMDELEVRGATLMVHDWGGAIGMGAALERPDLFERFIVTNTAAFPSRSMPFSIGLCRVPGFGAVAVRGLNAFARGALWRCVVKRSRLTSEVESGYLAPYGSWADRVALHRFVQDIPMSPAHPSFDRLRKIGEELHRLQERPMLIVWGGRDFCFHEEFFAEWRRRFPRAEAHFLEDCGHYVLEDGHEHLLPLVEAFLQKETSEVPVRSPPAGATISEAAK
jgi:haloalkane dehalogenase